MRRLLREQEQAGALPAALTISRDVKFRCQRGLHRLRRGGSTPPSRRVWVANFDSEVPALNRRELGAKAPLPSSDVRKMEWASRPALSGCTHNLGVNQTSTKHRRHASFSHPAVQRTHASRHPRLSISNPRQLHRSTRPTSSCVMRTRLQLKCWLAFVRGVRCLSTRPCVSLLNSKNKIVGCVHKTAGRCGVISI